MSDKPAAGKTGSEEEVKRPDAAEVDETAAAEVGAGETSTESAEKETPRELTLEEVQLQLAEALAQVEQYRDQALRAEAEMQNVRRRVTRDVENAHKFGTERFLVALLPTVDALEKAVEAASEDAEANRAILEGVEICLKMLMDALAREHVVQLDPEGEPFNPDFHEAIQMVERDDMEPNSVAMVIQKGYTLNERLVRPAMVIVAKEPAPAVEEAPATDEEQED